MDLEQAKEQVPEFVYFQTLEESKDTVFNSQSETYWRKAADYMVEQNQELEKIPEDFDLNWVVQEEVFNELLANKKLVDWINKPL